MQAALAFLLTSAVTAIVVRMLLTSGVVVLFPLFFLLRRVGVLRMLDLDFRLLSLSYPWLGVPMQRLRARRKPLAPFIMAHVVRVVVLYVMYEASQMFLAQLLYGKVGEWMEGLREFLGRPVVNGQLIDSPPSLRATRKHNRKCKHNNPAPPV